MTKSKFDILYESILTEILLSDGIEAAMNRLHAFKV